ncbi:MAG: tetratricopeptide repeat protein [Pseudomonadota bacterium]
MMIRALTRTLCSKQALAALVMAPALLVNTPAPALAQDGVSEARLRKLEAEIRALQRNVFPGGDERFFEPQIRPGEAPTTRNTSGPSTTAVTDILARLDAIEVQLQRLTGVTEENGNTIVQLTDRVAELEARNEATATVTEVAVDATEDQTAMDTNLSAMGAAQGTPEPSSAQVSELPELVPSATATETTATGPTAERLAAVQAITKPQTEDPADDEYSYGFRLWNAGFYPEARQQLNAFLDQYPDHWRATYGRNLLGRAYLDDGMTEEAARWFLRNYQTDRTAPRAADSLLFLADAMIKRDDTRRACIALAEFGDTYPALATGRLLDRYQTTRNRVTCEG